MVAVKKERALRNDLSIPVLGDWNIFPILLVKGQCLCCISRLVSFALTYCIEPLVSFWLLVNHVSVL